MSNRGFPKSEQMARRARIAGIYHFILTQHLQLICTQRVLWIHNNTILVYIKIICNRNNLNVNG